MGTKGVSSDWVKKTQLFNSLSEWTVMRSEDMVLTLTSFQVLAHTLPKPHDAPHYEPLFKASHAVDIFIKIGGRKILGDLHLLHYNFLKDMSKEKNISVCPLFRVNYICSLGKGNTQKCITNYKYP